MTALQNDVPASRRFLGRRNVLFLGAAVLALVAGYAVLSAGHPTAAAVLLVVGYCVLFPLGIAL
jgi:dipeptide/tripeptide permease